MSVPFVLDGPCHGWYDDHQLRRAPDRLVAVCTPGQPELSAIFDQPDDQVSYGEQAFVYERQGTFHVTMSPRSQSTSGWSYRVIGQLDRVTGEVTPITPEQRARWHQEQVDRALGDPPIRSTPTIPTTQEALF